MSSTQLAPYEDRIAEELSHPVVASNLENALPPWLNVAQFKAQAAIMAANPPKDKNGNPPDVVSMTTALLNAAQMGLMPGPSRHVAFVNRKGVLQAQPQWQGLQFLFELGGWKVTAHLVHATDTFEIEAIGPDEFAVTKHTYDPFAERAFAFPGAGLRGAYAKGVNTATGEIRFRFVNAERIGRAIGATYTSKDDTPWRTDFALMVAKTVFQQAAARRWFDMPAEVVARLSLTVDRDHEALEQFPQPTITAKVSRIAGNIAAVAARQLPAPETPRQAPQAAAAANAPSAPHAAAPAPSATPPTKPAEVPGWSDPERKWFMGEVNSMSLAYPDLAAWCESIGKPRPSGMTPTQRKKLLEAIAAPQGERGLQLQAWLTARREAQSAPPTDAVPDDDKPFFDPGE